MSKQSPVPVSKQNMDDSKSAQVAQTDVVLLVDDQPMVSEGIRRMLENEKEIAFHYCEDPTKALEMVIEIKPSVILQDLIMPDVDGMTLMRFYKNHPETKKIPVIVLSSKEDAKIKSDAFTSGANDYLVKMPDPIELVARIKAHSKHYRTERERDMAHSVMQQMQAQLEQANLELEGRNKELQHLSSLDGLTGIANRRRFDEIMDNEWRRARRQEGTQISLILIDVDSFKLYNDTYGHLQGDDCLKQVAWALASPMQRASDYVARYGGEEFVAVLIDTPLDGAMTIAQKMREAVHALAIPHTESKSKDFVTCSFGIATLSPGDSNSPAQLIEAADKALYRAKESGRDQIVVADS